MDSSWDQAAINQYINDKVEESTILEYKGADALYDSSGKKKEIAKDISSMANAAGGVIIYGIREYQERDKRHLPERIDPVDRTKFSKEWLSQVITHNIQPHIVGLNIFPVSIDNAQNHVVYVVEIPQSTTAHQVTADKDCRYYERTNFEAVRMEDYRIRDVMNRAIKPDVSVEFSYRMLRGGNEEHTYKLVVKVANTGPVIVNHFKLEFTFPDLERIPQTWIVLGFTPPSEEEPIKQPLVKIDSSDPRAVTFEREQLRFRISFRSTSVLFPEDHEDISRTIDLIYQMNRAIYANEENVPPLEWKLFAEEMNPKNGRIPFYKLHSF